MGKRLSVVIVCAFAVSLLAAGVQAETKKAAAKDEFAGSQACQRCHKLEFETWQKTFHSKMVQKRDDGILKDAVLKWSSDGTNPGPTKGNVTGKPVTILDVEYVVGSYWKQRFLVKNEASGGHQFLDKQFNRMTGKWENYGQKNDWETMCVTCHATGYRIIKYDPAKPQDVKYTWSEVNTGCESCHGPGAKHAGTKSSKDIWNPAKQPKGAQSRACGYCHIRLENERYRSAQGNPREDFPAPKVGDTFKPWDDWTKWYAEEAIIPGVQPEDKIDAEYKGDLKGLFILDDISRANGVYEEAKHHEEYQGFIQSKHFKNNIVGCNDCHSSHAVKARKRIDPKATCAACHGDAYQYDKIMPGTAKTADDLYVRTHTFLKGQDRPSKPTASGMPEYYFKK